MSTLTKVLIVLLSLASIFLSGIMVTFVATQQNYKDAYKNASDELAATKSALEESSQANEEKSFQMQELANKHITEKAELMDRISKLAFDKNVAETELNQMKAEASTWNTSISGFETTIANKTKTLELTQDELDKTREKLIETKKRLNELETVQYDKYVQVEQLQAQVRNLKEAKTSLEKRIEALTNGKSGEPAETVTKVYNQARPAVAEVPSSAPLKGVITEVGKSLVGISLGTADGVTEGTVFHVFRGNEFVCNLKITSTDVNQSAGVIELEMSSPKIGDTVSTKY